MSQRTCQISQREKKCGLLMGCVSAHPALEESRNIMLRKRSWKQRYEWIKMLHLPCTLSLRSLLSPHAYIGICTLTFNLALSWGQLAALAILHSKRKWGDWLLSHSIPMAIWKTGTCSSDKKIRRYLGSKTVWRNSITAFVFLLLS